MKATIHVTRRRILAAYLPVLDLSRPFAMLLHGSPSQQRWESHVVGEVENSWRHEAEETGANIASIVLVPVQRQPL
jgi:nitrogen fixation protein